MNFVTTPNVPLAYLQLKHVQHLKRLMPRQKPGVAARHPFREGRIAWDWRWFYRNEPRESESSGGGSSLMGQPADTCIVCLERGQGGLCLRGRRLCHSCVREMLALAPGDAGYGVFVEAIASVWSDILAVEGQMMRGRSLAASQLLS